MTGAVLALQIVASCLVTQESAVTLESRDVFAVDIVDSTVGACAALQERSGPVILSIAGPSLRVALPRTQLVAALRKHSPGTDVSCGSPDSCDELVTFISRDEVWPRAACARLTNSKNAGAIISPGDVLPAACEPGPVTAALVFDEDMGVLRAAALLEAGTNVGRVRPAAPPERLSGEAVTVTSLVGVVRVDQTATLLQPARSGAAVFVRTSSGAVLSVEVPSSGETAP